jgi:uncharacterized protein involved in exopolysaccharide biosynthesis
MDTGSLPEGYAPELGARASSDNDLSVVDMVRVLIQYKWWSICTTIAILGLAITYAFTVTPTYRAETILAPSGGGGGGIGSMISQFGGSLSGLAGLVGMGGSGSKSNKLTRGEALTSLTSNAHIQGFIAAENLLPVLFENLWDAEESEWLVESEVDIPTLSDGFDMFRNRILKVSEDPTTGIVNLSIEWKDPVLAADWANKLVGTLNANLREKVIKQSDKTIEFLNQELERTKVMELRQAVFFMIEQQIGDKTSARVQEEFAFKIINPAIAADRDKYISPDRPLIIGGGLIIGILGGIFVAFLAYAAVHLRKEFISRNTADT